MKLNTNPVRGTYDYLPKQAELREKVREKILKTYQNYGFSLIKTPILENLELLSGSDGGDNLKLMFKTIKRGDKLDLSKPNLTENDIVEEGLRYDLTVPLARFYSNNRERLPLPFKAIQIDYSFRAERPQRGRDRQFIQCDIDIIGDADISGEVDVLSAGMSAYKELGFTDICLKVNSKKILNSIIGHFNFSGEDIPAVCISLDKLDKIGIDGVREELIQVRNMPNKNVDNLLTALQDISKNGIDSCSKYGVDQSNINDVKEVINIINNLFKSQKVNSKCVFDISIIRGQGYYTGMVYEVYTEGISCAIGGGGRYDGMVEKITGVNVPAVGFSIGFSPVCVLLEENNVTMKDKKKIALVYNINDFSQALTYKQKLLNKYNVSLYKNPKNIKNLLEKLSFVGFDGFALYSTNESTITIKDFQ